MNSVSVSPFEESAAKMTMNVDSMTFVLFGATGDLAKRKIFPALYNLYLDNKLPRTFSVIGLGRRALSNDTFQSHVESSIRTFSRQLGSSDLEMETFIRSFQYSSLDVTDSNGYDNLLDLIQNREKELGIPENRMFYLSVAPEFINVITSNISKSGLGSVKGWKRLLIEKPFGHDLSSAQQLNAILSNAFEEKEIYRIDHYLGKPMIQNLETLEVANPLLQAVWNNQFIANVQITASETVGVEERAGYYDQAGAIRDMVQNHMLQILMMTAMHLPKRFLSTEVQQEKTKVMASVRPVSKKEAVAHIVRGQYRSGAIQGSPVIGYKEEPGILQTSTNDTFVAARLWIDDPFWQDVPFYIRTGKRMKEKSTRIVIELKNPLKELYSKQLEETAPNLLTIEISPNETISLQLNNKNPLNNGKIEPITIDFSANHQQEQVPEAYEQILHDALRGDATFFAHWEEVELSWAWIQPLLEAFEENALPLHLYEAGSMGPEASDQLVEEDGFKWW
ncbi:glucose-6-phosphate dehydrogenase [Domibacillus aminovorans]|uniref:glucose-6-phosphate dehydrogenase n=1 Tax=Domibacillus aminovorans TaxID=29332 RepID=UPI000A61D0E9|nr:glucose-6-phosphate dehydrogenase [Domibacillus aminovorans]